MRDWRIIDLREIAQEWSDEIDNGDVTRDYTALTSDLGIDGTPAALDAYANDFEPTLIHENYFTEYARELAEDVGAIDPNASWPLTYIDWERAADALKMDYTAVDYDGDTYYIRA